MASLEARISILYFGKSVIREEKGWSVAYNIMIGKRHSRVYTKRSSWLGTEVAACADV
jgi:hypothetical protein